MSPPEKINGGLEKLEVREFIPRPRRCFNCQGFGHMGAHCRRTEAICANCSDRVHTERNEACRRTPHCRNCRGNHPTTDRGCPTYKKEQEILTIVTREKVSFVEARKAVRRRYPDQGTSYSDVVKRRIQRDNSINELPRPIMVQKQAPLRNEAINRVNRPETSEQPGPSRVQKTQELKRSNEKRREITPERSDEETNGRTPPRKIGKTGTNGIAIRPKYQVTKERKETNGKQESNSSQAKEQAVKSKALPSAKPRKEDETYQKNPKSKEKEIQTKNKSLLNLPMPPGYKEPVEKTPNREKKNENDENKSTLVDGHQEQAISVVLTKRQEDRDPGNRDPRINRRTSE